MTMSGALKATSETTRRVILALAPLGFLVTLIPFGVYLQWFAPRDFVPARVCIYPAAGIVPLAAAWTLLLKGRTEGERGWPKRVAAAGLFALSIVVLVTTSVPAIGRRVGPWADLRSLLVAKSREVTDARKALGIPHDRQLTADEMGQMEALLFDPVPEYTFPIIQRTVHLRLMAATPPYVGLDFGGGRRVLFDLRTMVILYAD
jgi:hypothetical protein